MFTIKKTQLNCHLKVMPENKGANLQYVYTINEFKRKKKMHILPLV